MILFAGVCALKKEEVELTKITTVFSIAQLSEVTV